MVTQTEFDQLLDLLRAFIRREVIPVVEPLQAWVVDETGWLKQGSDSEQGSAHRLGHFSSLVGHIPSCP